MASITRAPTGQDLTCLVCHKQAQDIDHVVNRGMGGSKERDVPENKVPLCRECHTAKTNNVLETRLTRWHGDGKGLISYQWRRKDADHWITVPVEVSQRYKCLIERSLEEESDEQVGNIPVDGGRGSRGVPDNQVGELLLTHEQRVAIAAGIKEMEWGRQWLAGDTANEWENELGEDFWNTWANEFGYTYPSLRNNQRTAKAIPPPFRNAALRFGHHVVVADIEKREDQVLRLKECEENEWSVAEFRRQVKGTKPKVKRWSIEKMEEINGYPWAENEDDHISVTRFLEHLKGQERAGEQG